MCISAVSSVGFPLSRVVSESKINENAAFAFAPAGKEHVSNK